MMGDMQPIEPDGHASPPVGALYWSIYVLDTALKRWHRGLDRLASRRGARRRAPAATAPSEAEATQPWPSSPVAKRTV